MDHTRSFTPHLQHIHFFFPAYKLDPLLSHLFCSSRCYYSPLFPVPPSFRLDSCSSLSSTVRYGYCIYTFSSPSLHPRRLCNIPCIIHLRFRCSESEGREGRSEGSYPFDLVMETVKT